MEKNELKPWTVIALYIIFLLVLLFFVPYKETLECLNGKCTVTTFYIASPKKENNFMQNEEIYINASRGSGRKFRGTSYTLSIGSNFSYNSYAEAQRVLNKIKTESSFSTVQYAISAIGYLMLLICAGIAMIRYYVYKEY